MSPITWNSQDWIGEIGEGYQGYYADYMLLLTFGGIPWQVNIKSFCRKIEIKRSALAASALPQKRRVGFIITS